MDSEIQLIADGEGLAVIGDPADVERFLVSEGLLPSSKEIGLERTGFVVADAAGVVQAGSEIAANSGRWVKLTSESFRRVKKYGLRESSSTGLSTGVLKLKGGKGRIGGFVEFVKRPGSLVTNPALLSGIAGMMAQVAIQQTLAEITSYLVRIDAKVDDVLLAQKDAVLAHMIGVGLVVEEAITIRGHVGRVDEITWSKVQGSAETIAYTQSYALLQLKALAEKLGRSTTISGLAGVAEDAETKVQEWLAVLARCTQLQDAIAMLELDRVLDTSPNHLDGHRLGLKTAREARLDLIAASTEQLLARVGWAVGTANAKVLLHPAKSPTVVRSSNDVATCVRGFHDLLGIESGGQSWETRRWADAFAQVSFEALEKAKPAAPYIAAAGVAIASAVLEGLQDRRLDRKIA